ncbi:MAG: CopG family transcriptional regulator [Dehalococcoidia bacterium]
MPMVTERLAVRLDAEQRRQLTELALVRGGSVSEVVREMIDRALADAGRARRLQFVVQITQAQVEDVPAPEIVSQQLDETSALPDLY